MTQKLILSYLLISSLTAQTAGADDKTIAHGKYLTVVAGCNDCHTAGFAPSGGKIPEREWLLGDAIGWKGDWGTTYPTNLRKFVHPLTKEQWIAFCRSSKARPPMPSYVLNAMHEEDLVALFDFIKSLGDAGDAVPVALAPGIEPKTPYFNLKPANLPSAAPK